MASYNRSGSSFGTGAKASLQLTDSTSTTPIDAVGSQFKALSDNQIFDSSLLIMEQKPAFKYYGFAPSKSEGWIVAPIVLDDPAPVLIFGMSDDGTSGIYYATR